jgi:hypothetical protein
MGELDRRLFEVQVFRRGFGRAFFGVSERLLGSEVLAGEGLGRVTSVTGAGD